MNIYEQKIIGGIVKGLVQPSALSLTAADFETADLGTCLTIARQLEGDGIPIDAAILNLRLYEKDQGFFTSRDFEVMAQSVESASVVYEAADKVRSTSLRTHLISRASEIALSDKPASAILDDLRELVDKTSMQAVDAGFVWLKDIAPKTLAVIDDLYNRRSYSISSGFGNVDNLIVDGFSRGDAHIIVGFTGAGKSAFALNCAVHQARAGHVVGVISREMADVENHFRMIAHEANIPRYEMRMGMSAMTRDAAIRTIARQNELPIAFDTRSTTIEQLRPRVRRMCEQDGMEILYVDYLQLLTSESKSDSRANEVQAISRNLKLIAMENQIPVVSLCQFNRGAMNANLFDILGHLKESSGIEQDASTISYIQIERTEVAKDRKDAKLTILKNRNGATFQSAEFFYDGPTFKFQEKVINEPPNF